MDIKDLRKDIDSVDGELVELFRRRMELSGEIARWKKAEGRPVYDPAREHEKLAEIAEKSGEKFCEYAEALWKTLMEQSKKYQQKLLAEADEVV